METKLFRDKVLEKVGHNVMLIPEDLVSRDYLTDSLLNKTYVPKPPKSFQLIPKSVDLDLQTRFKELFGFPYVVPLSQGRVAEALLSRLLVRNGLFVPCSPLFPTTRIHVQLAGGSTMECGISEAYQPESQMPFKGNLDLDTLEKIIQTNHARWCGYICVEPCNNAVGGQPISMENMRGVSRIAKKYGVRVYLDATRIMENALFIRQREAAYRNTSPQDILKEFCLYADGVAMSATKSFATSSGAFFATREESLYHDALDFMMGFGSGLSFDGKRQLLHSMENTQTAFSLVERKMNFVRMLYQGISDAYPTVTPVGGHAVYIDAAKLGLSLPKGLNPVKAFLHHLYREYGVRASENPQSTVQEKRGIHLIRLALPLVGQSDKAIRDTARDLLKAAKEMQNIPGLEKVSEPPGMTGPYRAKYKTVAAGQSLKQKKEAYA